MARQSVIAENIAHVSSPGYRAVDVPPFAETLERTSLDVTATSARHMRLASDEARPIGKRFQKSPETSHSGNTVSLDQQLVLANEVRQAYAVNASIVKSMHRLLTSAAKA